jgi:hypothetical protein
MDIPAIRIVLVLINQTVSHQSHLAAASENMFFFCAQQLKNKM